ncbi:MAG: cytochrome-c oxidase, cbb3-type subunit II [Rhodobacteraceae bacterium]|nr:cytochrome-c oxidase, cbb3-type subunit II [Paracoccaceae bacterium]
MSLWAKHEKIEKNATLLLVLSLVVVSIGGMVEIAPLFYLENTIEKVKGMRPYTPLELTGRNIYIREGCYVCHSQMIRPMRDEVERYGHFSLAAESMYDHPFQWGSKRTGPDLARVGGRYSDDWHIDHLRDPRAVAPESIMPAYGFLEQTPLNLEHIADDLVANRMVGVPYNDEHIANAKIDLISQAQPDGDNSDVDALIERYSTPFGIDPEAPNVSARAFDRDPEDITEMDALIAYLQMLGTLVDFSDYEPMADANLR